MTKLHWRVAKIENRCGGGRAVVAIVRTIREASDEELYRMIKNGRLDQMAERLSDRQLEQLIAELKKMKGALR